MGAEKMAFRDFVTMEEILGGPVPPYLTVKQVAKIFQLDPSTVRRGCEARKYRKAFKLPSVGKRPEGDWRIPSRFLEQQIREAEEQGEFSA